MECMLVIDISSVIAEEQSTSLGFMRYADFVAGIHKISL